MSAGGGKGMKKMAHVGPNMTPMVDVVMCILIFFMLGSSFIMPELFLKSATAVSKEGLGTKAVDSKMPSVKLWIKMSREGNDTYVSAFDSARLKLDPLPDPDSKDASAEEHKTTDQIERFFIAKAGGLGPDGQVIIQPKSDVPYQDVITIYDFCVKAKFKQVAFAPAG